MALEIQGSSDGLLDDVLALRVRGAGPDLSVVWRARLRDDDERVWRATASRAEDLAAGWGPAKGGAGPMAALQSLRTLAIDVRAELDDGRAVKRTINRRLVAADVRVRRWRDGVAATLHRPAPGGDPAKTLIVDGTAGGEALAVALLAAPLLASRGVLAVVVAPGRGSTVAAATDLLAAVPGAAGEPVVVGAEELPTPPGVPTIVGGDREAAWDALLARLGARSRAPEA